MLLRYLLIFLSVSTLLISCGPTQEPADLVIRHATIYTMDEDQPTASALAVRGGKIVYVGDDEGVAAYIAQPTRVLELAGEVVIPGFVEGHAHLMGLGQFKRNLDLTQVGSYEEMVELVAEAVATTPEGQWIVGRGWHQSKWMPQPAAMYKGYQSHELLSAVSPDNPVFLTHASGHAAFANAKAMQVAGITPQTKVGGDGEIIRKPDGSPTGVFTEVAADLIESHIPADDPAQLRLDLQAGIDECLKHGITSFHDAGAKQNILDLYQAFLDEDKLDLRLHVMLTGSDSTLLTNWYARGPLYGDQLSVRAIKVYADGALGSRGAWLLEPYEDRHQHVGNPIMPIEQIGKIAKEGLLHGFQVCTHAIGDRANREVLDAYQAAFEMYPDSAQDARFRIEHAQHLHPDDIPRFAELGVIPAMQAIHMASDRPWAIDRLGEKRIIDGAYVWRTLLETGAVIVNGTDAPVEPVDPIACFYASVTRRTLSGPPIGGYEPGQKMTREEALRSYTLDAAYGAFREHDLGSLEVGKWGDITILSQDIMTVEEDKILDTEVLMTILGGEVKYEKP